MTRTVFDLGGQTFIRFRNRFRFEEHLGASNGVDTPHNYIAKPYTLLVAKLKCII